MKNLTTIFAVIALVCSCLTISTGQQNTSDIQFKVERVSPPLSLVREEVEQAKTLVDLNRFYKSEWVKEYHELSISGPVNGKIIKEISQNDELTQAQIVLLESIDNGGEINVKLKYIPENTLQHNEEKSFSFAFVIEPENPAEYIDGYDVMISSLQENVVKHIDKSSIGNDLIVIQFVIDHNGDVINVAPFDTYANNRNTAIEEVLINTICTMPKWSPARYADGQTARQEFVLTLGNLQSCVMNLLNIKC